MILLKLFLVFVKISFFAFGGAYSFLPLLEKDLVQNYQWMGQEEFADVLGMVQVIPGAISIKYATYTGYKLAGIPGVFIANVGNFLGPALLIVMTLALYNRYKDMPRVHGAFQMIQFAMFAMLLGAAFRLIDLTQLTQIRSILVVVVAFFLFMFTKTNPAFIVIAAGMWGALIKQ